MHLTAASTCATSSLNTLHQASGLQPWGPARQAEATGRFTHPSSPCREVHCGQGQTPTCLWVRQCRRPGKTEAGRQGGGGAGSGMRTSPGQRPGGWAVGPSEEGGTALAKVLGQEVPDVLKGGRKQTQWFLLHPSPLFPGNQTLELRRLTVYVLWIYWVYLLTTKQAGG